MKFKFILLVATLIGFSSCAEPDMSITEGGTTYGALATQNMEEYYYPKTSGWEYVYKHTIEEYSGGTVVNTITGPYDTLRTLGYQGFSTPEGDSVFAFSVTYRVLASKNNKNRFPIYYVTQGDQSDGNKGGFILGNNKTGFSNVDSVMTVAGAIDTILYAVEGPTRDVIDDYNSNATREYATDIIYFTAAEDSVVIWFNDGQSMRRVRQLWFKDFDRGEDWQYGLWENETWFKCKDESEIVQTSAGTFNCAEILVMDDKLEGTGNPCTEKKWFGYQTGLVKQYDRWKVTSNGTNFNKRVRVRELISKTHN